MATHTKATKARGNRRKSAPEMINAERRQTEALRLRQQGLTFERIAAAVGYANKGTAYNAVMAALCEVTTEANNEMRQLELSRLDELQTALWPEATKEKPDQGAVDRVLKVMERRSKILGLDAAPKLPQGDIDELIEKELQRIALASTE